MHRATRSEDAGRSQSAKPLRLGRRQLQRSIELAAVEKKVGAPRHGIRTQLLIGRQLRSFGDELFSPVELSRGLSREARLEQAPGPNALFRRKARSALQRSSVGRDVGTPERTVCRLLERGCDLLVRPRRGRRQMPAAPVWIASRLGERAMGGATVDGRHGVVDR